MDRPVHRLFEERAADSPGALAVSSGNASLTYAELNDRASRLARHLRRLGAGPEHLTALLLERSPDLVVSAVATFKAGAAYLPIDPVQPVDRVGLILRDSGARTLITTGTVLDRFPGLPAPEGGILLLDRLTDPPQTAGEPPEAGPESLAYVIYTSGSTGTPKGVELRHGGLSNLVTWNRGRYALRPEDRCSMVASPGFDASLWEMWPALTAGASLHLPPREVLISPADFLPWVARERITVALLPTPLAEAVLAEPIPPGLCLRSLVTGGDRLVRRPPPDLRFALGNVYGPTETTIGSTEGLVAAEGERPPHIGRPIANVSAHILDQDLLPIAADAEGELYIGGVGVGRGYLRRPELTAERFVPDPFGEPGSRMYRTGDLARRLPSGDLEFIGRIDTQVKIRGFRIELGEIEAALLRHPEVREAAALVRDGRLVGYVALRTPPSGTPAETAAAESLEELLAVSLPDPMVPRAWVFLDALPLNANDKIDRHALAELEPTSRQGAVAPRTVMETAVAEVWAEVLGSGSVGATDDFFALGGHSLLAARLAARLRERTGVETPPGVIFQEPTVERLAAWIEARSGEGGAVAETPAGTPDRLPLSFAQQRLWFLDRMEPGSAAYNIAFRLRFAGPLRPEILAAALAEVVRRHEVLRTTFEGDTDPVQVVHPPRFDLMTGLPVIDLDPAAATLLEAEEARRPFDLRRGPLMRAQLLRLGEEDHRLVAVLHHTVFDGTSVEVLRRELGTLYGAFAAGKPSPLPELPLQYTGFTLRQRSWMAGGELERQLSWWREKLAAPQLCELPADRPRPPVWSYRGAVETGELPPGLPSALERLGRSRGVTPFMTLLAGFLALLHRWTSLDDLLVGTPVAGRGRADVEELIGFFVNTLPLRVGLHGEPAFADLLARVRDAALEAYTHQDVPFEKLVAAVAPERDLSRNPLFQVLFAYLDLGQPETVAPGLTMAGAEEIHAGTARFDLSFHVNRTDGGLHLWLEHSTDLFDGATIRRLMGHFGRLLEAAVERPEIPIAELPLLTAAEQAQLAALDEAERRGHPVGLLHGLFEEQARRTPEAVALVAGETVLTYAELEQRSAETARTLLAMGAGPEVGVAVCLERTAELIVTLLGVLRVGSFYVPIDPKYPEERRSFLVEDSGARIVVNPGWEGAPSPAQRGRGGEGASPQSSNLAYLIYTSGSTGRPKAVAITHASAVKMVYWAREIFSPEELRSVLACTAVTFDLSVYEIFVPLACGGTVVLVEDALSLLSGPPAAEITLVNTVPSAMTELLRARALPASVRTINLAGEALTRSLSDRVYERPETERLYNLYGPSEDTTYSTWTLVERASERGPSIGRPIHDTRAYVVDRRLERLPMGVPGELCLAGDGLARGYLGRPELTAERFLPDPFASSPGERMYRTGDLVKLRADGQLDYLGRMDHQVKIRGYRIELGEIESALVRLPGIKAATVMVDDGAAGRRLVAYLAADERPAAEIREALLRTLPEPLVPAAFVFLAELPLTPHGKVDRKALARLAPSPEARGASEPLRTPTEAAVAAIWSELLGVSNIGGIGASDDFFALGGHSLLATGLTVLVKERLGVDLPVRTVFQQPTVARLAAWIDAARPSSGPALVPGLAGENAPLSFAQQRLWFLDRLEPGSPAYNLPVRLRFVGPLRTDVLAAALTEIVRRHEALRTTFEVPEGAADPVQVIHAPAVLDLPVTEVREDEEARRPFDLRNGPLLRAALVRRGEEDHRLLVTFHHSVFDGTSLDLLRRELADLYRAFAEGRPSPLSELPVQYRDFAVWQRSWLAGEEMERELGWWRERLASPQALELPADRPRPAVWSHRGAVEEAELPERLAAALETLGRSRGATPFMSLLAAFLVLLHRYTNQDDLLVGTPVSGRGPAEVEGLIGFFVNTLPLRVGLHGEPSFADVLERVRDSALAAYAHQEVPFEKLVAAVAPERDLSRNPLFQLIFAFLDGWDSTPVAPGLTMEADGIHTGTAKFDLSFHVNRSSDRLRLWLEYATDLFDGATIRRLIGHFGRLLEGAVESPGIPVAELPLLTAAEQAQLAALDEAEHRGHPAGLLHGLFEEQARRTPEAVALVAGETVLTYAELERRSAGTARTLRAMGAGPEVGVAVCLERTAELIVTLLGVLRAGSFYVPIDPKYPEERRSFLVEDSGARIVVSPGWEGAPSPAQRGRDGEGASPQSSNLAYLIYTSGSTGRPKAVAITHASAVKMVRWARAIFKPEELRSVLACTAVTFDLSVYEIFVPLAAGGTVVLVEDALALLSGPPAAEITLVNTVPSAMTELLRARALPASVRTINLAGEALTRSLSDRVYERPETERLYNLYGPSEDTTYSTWTLVERASERGPSIGRPIHDTRAYVVDRRLERLPMGVPGELCLAGDGLARGYLGRPELTAERFVPDPFASSPGERMYRTGDLVKLRSDGELDYLGRMDHQVKIRGYRIELGEIESALVRLPGIKAATVMVDDGTAGRRLVAYLAADERPTAEIREELLKTLPEPMVPAVFVFLADLPLTPHGKVDRKALARLAPAPEVRGASEPLRTPMEAAVAAIWSELLGVSNIGGIGASDDFFALGGHSLLATRLAALVQERLGVELPVRTVFQHPTVARLAAWIEAARPVSGPALVPGLVGERAPLSFAQQRLWFFERLQPDTPAYNVPFRLDIAGPLSADRLAEALAGVVRRQASLRTTFEVLEEGGDPVQVVHPSAEVSLDVRDLSHLPAGTREAEAVRLAESEARQPFDLRSLPLLRATLLRLGEEEHRLLVTLHHIVSDGWSLEVLQRELAALYDGAALPELPVQYPDFAVWQKSFLAGDTLADQIAWWRERLERPPVVELPTDRPRPAVWSYRGGLETAALPVELADRLDALGRRHGATPFMTLFAAFLVLLQRHASAMTAADLIVGTPVAGRLRPEIQGLIGFFVNTLALRVPVDGAEAFDALLARVRETALDAYDHQEVPFEALVAELAPGRDLSRTPIVQVVFAMQDTLEPVRAAAGPVFSQGEWAHSGTAKFDLSLHAGRENGRLRIWAEYGTDLFDAATIRRLVGRFGTLLEGIAAGGDARVSDLPLLDPAEREQVLAAWNRTEDEIPDEPVHRLFFRWAERTPDAVAVSWPGGRLTYGELAGRVRDLAFRLRAWWGVGPETLVALRFDRSAELLTAALAVLEAGGAYLPVDPANPAERTEWILQDSGAALALSAETLALLAAAPIGARETTAQPDPDALAYVIYTSGSTGRPKGTELRHRGLSSFIAWHRRSYDLGPGDRTTLVASPGFDASVWETWSALASGAAVHIPAREVLLSPPALLRWMAQEGITVSFLPTPLAEAVLSEELPEGLRLRALLTGGDRLRRRPAAGLPFALVNHYGPTESTVVATAGRVAPEGERVPDIGAPIANIRVYLLDRWLQPVPPGVAGELCLTGEGLARGYRHRPELTAERFVPDPFGEGGRLYRTGDLARRLTSGEIEFLGRMDHQVKIRGNRIELGEVEAALTSLSEVEACVVVARPDDRGEDRLVAYVVPKPGRAPQAPDLRIELETRLPAPMIPAVFVMLDALPLDVHGKIDRRALPAPAAPSAAGFTAPRTPLEEEVARIWGEVLGVERIGVDDSFWDLGGHSLLATRALSRLEAAFGVELPLQLLFTAPALGAFSSVLAQKVLASEGAQEMEEAIAALDGLSEDEVRALIEQTVRDLEEMG